ncbi:hypothetical protein SOM28_09500 [Massilia sp. CFBP9026]|nr:hypothetical protein [Massilia sp. CFBP9026]MDY0962354.1 hypothetical protein [Massilia sp. CFBP9026]
MLDHPRALITKYQGRGDHRHLAMQDGMIDNVDAGGGHPDQKPVLIRHRHRGLFKPDSAKPRE